MKWFDCEYARVRWWVLLDPGNAWFEGLALCMN